MRNFVLTALKKTEKFPAEEKVKIYEELLKNIAADDEMMAMVLDSISSGVMVSNQDHNIVFVNKYMGKLTKIRKTELMDCKVWSLFHDTGISGFIMNAVNSSNNRPVTKVFNFTDKTKLNYIEFRVSRLKNYMGNTGHIITVENVTDREVEKRKEKRAESFSALTALTAGMAHEIKNPLGSISIYLQLMKKQLSKTGRITDPDEFRHKLTDKVDILSAEVERLNNIIVDFLATIRPRKISPMPYSINDIVKDVINLTGPELKSRHIDIKLMLEENMPLIMLDKQYIRQVITNLVVNARDAMKKKGKGTLSVRTEKNSESIILKISDTGEGIPNENLSKLFDPYFTTKDSGTGIGLTIVYRVIREHNGDILVISKVGEGTTFKIVLPRIEKEIHQIAWEEK